MDRNTNKIVSVENHQNKTDVEELKLDEFHQKFPTSDMVCRNYIFANLCRENGAKMCDEKNMGIFNTYSKQGG